MSSLNSLVALSITFTIGCNKDGLFDGVLGEEEDDPDCYEASYIDPWDEEYCAGQRTYLTAAHMVAPYGWKGDFYAALVGESSDQICEDASECLFEPEEPSTYMLPFVGDLFLCVMQETELTEIDEPATVDFTWEGEGQCGLAPDGEYGGFDVRTDTLDWIGYDQVWIQIGPWGAIVTKDTFYRKDSDYILEGTIASDLSSITYHLVSGSLDETATITLQ